MNTEPNLLPSQDRILTESEMDKANEWGKRYHKNYICSNCGKYQGRWIPKGVLAPVSVICEECGCQTSAELCKPVQREMIATTVFRVLKTCANI